MSARLAQLERVSSRARAATRAMSAPGRRASSPRAWGESGGRLSLVFECTSAFDAPRKRFLFPSRIIVGIVGRHMSLGVYPDQLPIRDLWVIRGEPEIRKALGQVLASPKPRLPAIPRTRAHLSPEAYPRSSYALHTCIHLSLNPLSPERDSNDPLDTSTAARRMDGSMLRRGDENRAVTPGKAMRAVRHPPSRFRERVTTHVHSSRMRT